MDQIRKTEWSRERSGGDAWKTGESSGRLSGVRLGIGIGAMEMASAGGADGADGTSIGWILQALETGVWVGVFPQCPTGLQQWLREAANMKY